MYYMYRYDFHLLVVRLRACHERKIRMLAKLRSDYPYQRQESEVSNQDMKYRYPYIGVHGL